MTAVTRRLGACRWCVAAFAVVGALAPEVLAQEDATEPERPADYGGFVYVEDGRLKLNGGNFYFSGANSYAMTYSRAEAEAQMQVAQSLGLNAIRMWGFWDGDEPTLDDDGNPIPDAPPGTDRWGRYVLQSSPRVYEEEGFRKLDYAIYLAHVYGMKLVLPLLNEWDEFGGLRRYMEWHDVELPEVIRGCGEDGEEICFYENEEAIKAERYKFFTECQECKDVYFDYVHQVLTRVNTYTGVAYKDDPAIMIWEVMNEPRYGPWEGNPDATVIRDFIQETAQFIKSIDQRHLVASGEEGFLFPSDTSYVGYAWTGAAGEGSAYSLNSAIPEIDVATFHAWPFNWAMAQDGYGDRIEEFIPEWVTEHARIARELGKPVYLGEFGWQILRREGSDVADRDAMMLPAYQRALEEDLDGIMYWHVTDKHDPAEATYTGPMEREILDAGQYADDFVPHDQDFRFDIYCPEDVTTCGIIQDATAQVVAKVQNPDPPFTSVCFAPRTVCDDACVLLDSHPAHCGACGVACGDGESCNAGTCEARSVPQWDDDASPYDTAACAVGSTAPRGGLSWALALAAAVWLRRRRRG